jgi:hypothetical protein
MHWIILHSIVLLLRSKKWLATAKPCMDANKKHFCCAAHDGTAVVPGCMVYINNWQDDKQERSNGTVEELDE